MPPTLVGRRVYVEIILSIGLPELNLLEADERDGLSIKFIVKFRFA
jgi:hypothetical protein